MKHVIVVGGGILGASTAYHLCKLGASVTVIDRQDVGQATEAAAGIICPWVSQRRNKKWYTLARTGAAYYDQLIPTLEDETGLSTSYKKVGAISLQKDDEKLMKSLERLELRREAAPEIGEIKVLQQADIKTYAPIIDTNYNAVHVAGAARVNGRELRDVLKQASINYGAKWIKGNALFSVENSKVQVTVDNNIFTADAYAITAGAWANEIHDTLHLEVPVSVQKGQIIHLQTDHETSNWTVVMPPNDQYLLGLEDGKVIIGATHENDNPFDMRVTAGGALEVLQKGLELAPSLADTEIAEVRVGFRPFTGDFLPVIGESPKIKGIYIANGLGASGLTVGPFLGQQLAKLILSLKTDIDLSTYSPWEFN